MMAEKMMNHGDNCIGPLPNVVRFVYQVRDLLKMYNAIYHYYPRKLAAGSYLPWYGFTTYAKHGAFSGGQKVDRARLKGVTGIMDL